VVRRYLLPREAEQDPGFRDYILDLSHRGLRLIAWIEIIFPVLMVPAQSFVTAEPASRRLLMSRLIALLLLGALTLGLSRTSWSRRWGRILAVTSGWISATILVCTALLFPSASFVEELPMGLIVIPLICVVVIPLWPLHVLELGLATPGFYALAFWGSGSWNRSGQMWTEIVFLVMISLLCTALSSMLYTQRHSSYRAHQEALRIAEDLRQSQLRVLLSENAASMGRLAAALSHDFNSPIGALRSSAETLLSLAGRISPAPAEKREELLAALKELCVAVRDSSERLYSIIARIQRFTNLDRAEVQSIDLNILLQDVVTMFQSQAKGNVRVEMNLRTVPRLVCRPQQLSGVFSTLFSHAMHVAGEEGTIRLTTRQRDGWIDICLQEEGGGISSSELAAIFHLNFGVSENRISSGNWSLFSSRHFVREHGGDITIARLGKTGLTVTVTLPLKQLEDSTRDNPRS